MTSTSKRKLKSRKDKKKARRRIAATLLGPLILLLVLLAPGRNGVSLLGAALGWRGDDVALADDVELSDLADGMAGDNDNSSTTARDGGARKKELLLHGTLEADLAGAFEGLPEGPDAAYFALSGHGATRPEQVVAAIAGDILASSPHGPSTGTFHGQGNGFSGGSAPGFGSAHQGGSGGGGTGGGGTSGVNGTGGGSSGGSGTQDASGHLAFDNANSGSGNGQAGQSSEGGNGQGGDSSAPSANEPGNGGSGPGNGGSTPGGGGAGAGNGGSNPGTGGSSPRNDGGNPGGSNPGNGGGNPGNGGNGPALNGPGNAPPDIVFVPDSSFTGDEDDPTVSAYPSTEGDLIDDPDSPAGEPGGGLDQLTGPDVAAVPEPTGLVLLGSGLVLVARSLRRRVRT